MSGTNFGGIVLGLLIFLGIAAYMSIGRDGAVEIINEAAAYVPSLSRPDFLGGSAVTGPDAGDPTEEAEPVAKPRARRRPSTKTEPAQPPEPAVAPIRENRVERPIPGPTNELLGVSSRELDQSFGAPAITAFTVSSDSLIETQVFVDDARGASTILRLENGIVVEVQKGVR